MSGTASSICVKGSVDGVSTAAATTLPTTRGLHSFPFQLNLRSSVHRMTQMNS
jgi:hypothetical protein